MSDLLAEKSAVHGTEQRRDTNAPRTERFFDEIGIDILLRQLSISGREISLAPKECTILYALLEQAGETVSLEALKQAAGSTDSSRSVESLIYRLRKKLDGSGYRILAVRGEGYCFVRLRKFNAKQSE